MLNRISRYFSSRWGIITAGALISLLAALLQKAGNPGNMGICVACFERDIAGALGLHRVATVQYLRPEIIAFVLGSMVAALVFREFRPRGGSAPLARFFLGIFAMIGALVFLGCPWRTLLRLGGGDLNALTGIAGLTAGIAAGVWFLKQGYSLGRSQSQPAVVGWLMPGFMLVLLLLAVFQPRFSAEGPIFASLEGPGSMHAALWISLAAGLLIGFVAQRSRFCTMGAVRDVILMRDTHLLSGAGALLLTAFIANLALGQFKLGFAGQPIAHTNHLWNFLGMVLAGLAFALAGGCPGRQLFLSGEGDSDAGVFVLGMLVGAGFAHNFFLASSPDKVVEGALQAVGGPGPYGQVAVLLGLIFCIVLGFSMRLKAAVPQKAYGD